MFENTRIQSKNTREFSLSTLKDKIISPKYEKDLYDFSKSSNFKACQHFYAIQHREFIIKVLVDKSTVYE